MSDRKDERGLDRIFESLAEYVREAPDEEILEHARDRGLDVEKMAEEFRATAEELIRRSRFQSLLRDNEAWRAKSNESRDLDRLIPAVPDKCRALLDKVVNRYPELFEGELTLQNRGLDELTDEDVRARLRNLAAQGVLDRLDSTEGEP